MSLFHFRSMSLLAVFLVLVQTGTAQKKVLDHSVYDSWKSINRITITDDGEFGAHLIAEQEGDNVLFIHNLRNKKQLKVPYGYDYKFVPGQRMLVSKIKAPFAVTREEKIKKTKKENMPKDSLCIVSLDKFSVTKIPGILDYKLGKEFSSYVAYSVNDSTKKKTKDKFLIVRELSSGKEDTIRFVSAYEFSPDGKALAVITKPDAKDTLHVSEVIFIDLEKYRKKIISSGKTDYKAPAFAENGKQFTFLATADSTKKEIKEYMLYYFDGQQDSARMIADRRITGMPEAWSVSEHSKPRFSENGKRLFFGIAPIPLPKDTLVPDFEKATLDIWHWQNRQTPPQELKELKNTKSYLSYIDLSRKNQLVQLENKEIPDVELTDEENGRYAIGMSQLKYELSTQWSDIANVTYDLWVYDLETGSREVFKEGLQAKFWLSPKGKYLLWYDMQERMYYSYAFADKKERCLTQGLTVNLWNEDMDMPATPPPYGVGAWKEQDAAVWVYDKFDIWQLDPENKKSPQNLTASGRKENISFRYIKTDPESRYIGSKETVLLSAFNKASKESGFYSLQNTTLKRLIMDTYTFTAVPVKAKNKNTYLFTKSNFQTAPDLHITTNHWKSMTRLTDANPQMREYYWGKPELIEWQAYNGKMIKGILYKPEGFDPEKKYPMMVYFYEKHSDDLYRYMPPAPSRSIINIPFYCSRGYLVFTPDIHYTPGNPGQDAYDCIVSGVEMLCKNDWVDKEHIGMQGQSWGGYQTAYLITRTDIFKAAGAGAPVSNMFSAYGGIRWGSGRSRQMQYEHGQSRIGKNMWEAPELYHRNSPVFFADKVNTPLLIMHNDNDGAVPWYQGIEYFMALKRLQKPVWMLQYNKEDHNLMERRNAKDLSIRLQQFFDHYLKGEPMPAWMKRGIPADRKGQDFGYELE